MADVAAAVCGAGVAIGGTEIGGTTGAGLVIAGVGVPTAWLAFGASRTRRRLDAELVARRRATSMANAQDSRIQALRQRLRAIDAAAVGDRGELAAAQSGLLSTRVELAAMRAELAATRHDLATARTDLIEMREQLSAVLATKLAEVTTGKAAAPGSDLVAARPGEGMFAARLILPPGLVLPARADAFTDSDRQVFDAFAETDLDDLTGILNVTAVAQHVADHEDDNAEAEPEDVSSAA